MPLTENEPTLAEWQRIYAEHEKSLPERRFTMLHGKPGRWPDDDFGPDRDPGPDPDPRPLTPDERATLVRIFNIERETTNAG